MASISEVHPKKSLQSVRVNDALVEICKDTGIPFTNIVEACLAKFSTMNDEDRIKFLVENDPAKVESSKIIKPSFDYAERAIEKAKENLGNKYNDRTSIKLLLAIGLVMLLSLFIPKKES